LEYEDSEQYANLIKEITTGSQGVHLCATFPFTERQVHVTAELAKSGIDCKIITDEGKHVSFVTTKARRRTRLAGERRSEEGR
jgi:hypothetical protein